MFEGSAQKSVDPCFMLISRNMQVTQLYVAQIDIELETYTLFYTDTEGDELHE